MQMKLGSVDGNGNQESCHRLSRPSSSRPMSEHFDPDEIGKFEALAEEWWDPSGRFKPLHLINPLRLDYIGERVDLGRAAVLDVGCGGGLLAEGMAQRGARMTAVDRSGKALAVARIHAEQSGTAVDYQQSDAQTWAESHPQAYDVVTCLEVLEHVPDVPGTVAACASMLKPDGAFFFATLNRTFKSYLMAILGAEYVLGWLPRGTHRYQKFIRPSEMVEAMRPAALDAEDMRGMSYRPLTDRFELSTDLSVNYLGMARKRA